MAINKPAAASIAAFAIVLGLAGCSSAAPEAQKTEKPTETTASETQKTEETSEPEETEAETDAGDGDVAAPGTTVAVGEEVVVPWGEAEGATQPVSVTVKSITAGSIDDFAVVGAEFQAKLEGYTPYYITVEATKVDLSGAPLAYESLYGDMGGIDADGRSMSPVSIIGDFEPCNTASLDATFDEGTPQTFCYIVAGPDTGEIGGATFEPYDSDYNDEPVVWTK